MAPAKLPLPEAAADELRLVLGVLLRKFRSEAPRQDLTYSEQAVLKRLHEHGPSTTAALARAELVKPQSMGVTLAALERSGFVSRKPDATDGRRQNVSLTAKAKRVFLAGRAARQSWLAGTIAEKLDPGEQRVLMDAIALLRKVVST